MTHSIEQLRIEATKAGLYAIEESQNRWLCIKKSDMSFLARGVRTEAMAFKFGLDKMKLFEAVRQNRATNETY